MKTSDKKFYFIVITSLIYTFLFLASLGSVKFAATLGSFPLFVLGVINASGHKFGGVVLGLTTGSPNSRNPKHHSNFREFNGFLGWLFLIGSFALVLVAINAYNK